jgi:hypothetical protein
MEKSKRAPKDTSNGIVFKREEDFYSGYANNTLFEGTIWDLKIYFGQTDIAQGANVVVQHTAITLPWNYAKIFSYLLQTQIAAREAEDGRIPVPKHIVPTPPTAMPTEFSAHLKHPKEGIEAIQKLWQAFVAANPELE